MTELKKLSEMVVNHFEWMREDSSYDSYFDNDELYEYAKFLRDKFEV